MKATIILLLFALLVSSAHAQQESPHDVPRLLKEYALATTDTARILLKCKLGEAFRSSKPDTSLILATEALSKSKEIGFKKGEVHAKVLLCVMYREKGDLPYALELGLDALRIADKERYPYGQVYAMIRVANIYIIVRDMEKAVSYLKRSDELLKNNYHDYQWVVVHYFLAVAHEQLNDLDAAEREMKIYDSKLRTFPDWFLVTSRLRANIAVKKNQLPLAIQYYREAYNAGMAEESPRETATTSNSMAGVFKKLGQVDSAIFYAKEGLRLGQQLNYRNRILAASGLLAELYAEKDPKEAVKYYQIASAAKDSLYGVEKVLNLQFATMKEQERKSEEEATRIAYQNKLKQWTLLGGVAVFLVIALLLYRNNRQKHRTNKVLEATLTNLKNTQSQLIQSEKMASLGELTAGIAHEIQNPLNFVNNFSEINTELVDEASQEIDKGNLNEVRSLLGSIKDNENKITHHGKRADAIVKGMLQHSRSGSGRKELTDINALADEYLRLAYYGFRAKDNSFSSDIETNFDKTIGKVNLIPQDIGRVLLNLINNAFYAIHEKQKSNNNARPDDAVGRGYEPIVTISTKKQNAGKVEIRVSDNGNGIPQKIVDKIFQPFFTTKPTGQGTGLGLSLSYDIVKAHGGDLKVETKVGSGTDFVIVLPA